MRQKIIDVCIAVVLVCSISGCAQTAEEALVAEPESGETDAGTTADVKDIFLLPA